jgi:ABC-type microcin C transport system permease subunit YejE
VPFFSYYSLKTHPGLFTFGLAVASFVAGLVLSVLWRRPRNWQHNWDLYTKGFIAAIASLPVLFVLLLFPATFLFAMFLSIYGSLAAIALAALMLGMQLGDLSRTGQLGTGPSA